MKTLKFVQKLQVVVFICLATTLTYAQNVLPEIVIRAANYKYLDAVSAEESSQPINMVEQAAAAYDMKGQEFYEDEYDKYFVSFIIPEGKILAAYDKDGTLLRTAERYSEVALPMKVKQAVATKYPGWYISEDVYLVNYQANEGVTRKLYKLLLETGNKKMRVKITDKGEFL